MTHVTVGILSLHILPPLYKVTTSLCCEICYSDALTIFLQYKFHSVLCSPQCVPNRPCGHSPSNLGSNQKAASLQIQFIPNMVKKLVCFVLNWMYLQQQFRESWEMRQPAKHLSVGLVVRVSNLCFTNCDHSWGKLCNSAAP